MARKKKSKLLYDTNDWTFERLKIVDDAIANIVHKELKLDTYPSQIEIIGSDQMLEAYSSSGLPIMYDHWSFGKRYLQEEKTYRKGMTGLAYEIVINSNPCISYLMEENSMTMQTLVIAHVYGHNAFFKNNYLFKQWTNADSIIDYLSFAKKYIAQCEEKYGPNRVEKLLDCLHSIMYHGVDKYKRPSKLNKAEEELDALKDQGINLESTNELLQKTKTAFEAKKLNQTISNLNELGAKLLEIKKYSSEFSEIILICHKNIKQADEIGLDIEEFKNQLNDTNRFST